jgi:hypothetical protein
MNANRARALASVVLGLSASGATAAHASDAVGAYARPLKVVLEPDATAPVRVQIHGVIAVTNPAVYPGYAQATCGYTYYQCPAGKESLCRMEWADIQKAVDRGLCVGWGSRRDYAGGSALLDNGRVRPLSEAPRAPDPWIIGMGVPNPSCQSASSWYAQGTPYVVNLTGACTLPLAEADAGAPGGTGGAAPPPGTGGAAPPAPVDAAAADAAAPAEPPTIAENRGCSFGGSAPAPGLLLGIAAAWWLRRRSR